MNKLIPLTLAAIGLATPASAQINAFQHIILVIQENRTPDNFFQGLCTPTTTNPTPCSTQPSSGQYNIQIPSVGWSDKTSKTGTTTPHSTPFGLGYDISHNHLAFTQMCDPSSRTPPVCAMDGAAAVGCLPKAQTCPPKKAYGYVECCDLQPYLDMVHAYGWGNYFFQTNQGASLPAHQFLFGATSAPTAHDDHHGIFAAGNTGIGKPSGCIAAPGTTVALINPQGVEDARVYPCFEHQTLSDLLNAVGVSWRYYGDNTSGIWMAPNAIKHICKAVDGQCTGQEWTSHIEPSSAVLSDSLTKCRLPGVSWVTPDGKNSDHSGYAYRTGGPSWVASIVNAVGKSTCTDTINGNQVKYWDDTAILVTWDDWGGWYDHVAPMIEAYPQGGYQMGFRVPLIVVSAYTRPGYIHNRGEDFGGVARFIEKNLLGATQEGALTFADARAKGDLAEFFSLGNPPRPFQPISTPLSAQHFIDTPPSGDPPDDD